MVAMIPHNIVPMPYRKPPLRGRRPPTRLPRADMGAITTRMMDLRSSTMQQVHESRLANQAKADAAAAAARSHHIDDLRKIFQNARSGAPQRADMGAVIDEPDAGGGLDQAKACKMLEDGTANGQPLSAAQKRLFGMICSGNGPRRAENGTVIVPRDFHLMLSEANYRK